MNFEEIAKRNARAAGILDPLMTMLMVIGLVFTIILTC